MVDASEPNGLGRPRPRRRPPVHSRSRIFRLGVIPAALRQDRMPISLLCAGRRQPPREQQPQGPRPQPQQPHAPASGTVTAQVDHTVHVEVTLDPDLRAKIDQVVNSQAFTVPLIGDGSGRMDSDAGAASRGRDRKHVMADASARASISGARANFWPSVATGSGSRRFRGTSPNTPTPLILNAMGGRLTINFEALIQHRSENINRAASAPSSSPLLSRCQKAGQTKRR